VNVEKIKAALYALIEALEDQDAPSPPPKKPRASRRGAAIRTFVRTTPRDGDTGAAEKILRVKGLL
jgi:hypothetical protein